MDDKRRLIMYAAAKAVHDRPLDSTETPEGQKFPIGTKVRLLKGWGSFGPPLIKAGEVLTVNYSYWQKFGWMTMKSSKAKHIKDYCLQHPILGECAWFDEEDLEAV